MIGVETSFMRNLAIILSCALSSKKINFENLRPVIRQFHEFYIDNYANIQNITPTVHKIMHLEEICQFLYQFDLTPGGLSEQTIELAHKFTKKFKKMAFNSSRASINRDIISKFSLMTDLEISQIIAAGHAGKQTRKMISDEVLKPFFIDE